MFKLLNLTLILGSFTNFALAKNKVVAKVNGVEITKNILDKRYQENQLYLSHKKITREKVLYDIINRELGVQRAKKNKLDQDPVVAEKINTILYHAQIARDLEPKFKSINVTDGDVKKFYRVNKEYRTSHILIRLKADPTKEETKSALELALQIFQKVKAKPESFAEEANRYSQSTAAATGGDIGFQPPTRLAPEYFNAIKGKKIGHITRPVKTQFGFHIIKVLGVKDYKEINPGVYKKIIYDMRRDKVIEDYFAKVRSQSKVKIFKDNM